MALCQPASGQFWYSGDGPEPLTIDSNKVTFKFEAGFGPSGQEQLLNQVERIAGVIDDQNLVDGFVACSLATSVGYTGFVDSLSGVSGIYLVEPYYLDTNGYPMLVGEQIIVAFDAGLTGVQIDCINAAHNVGIGRALIGMPNVYTIKNTDSSDSHLLDLANSYHELAQTRYAQPDFRAHITTCSYTLYDYYNEYQPHTKQVIGDFNTASVWDFAGVNDAITVALLDDGLTSHEDLPAARILDGYDFGGDYSYDPPDDDPSPGPWRAHGMATGGIIAASHTTDSAQGAETSTGVISMDPHVNILPVKIFNRDGSSGGVQLSELADAINYAWIEGADILSNSWGFWDPWIPDQPPITEALQNAYDSGRGGLGCPLIFASGNTDYWFPYPGKVCYPAHLDVCFAVGATRLSGRRWDYSRYDSTLDMVAPSADTGGTMVWSLDQMSYYGVNTYPFNDCPPGENDDGYHCHFGGTSAACPLVSGTAALLLSRDSTLSVQEVYNILRYSADTSVYFFGWYWPPMTQYGYGRVDAFRAVLSISRGDVNNDCAIDISDLVYLVDYRYCGGPAPFPSVLLADWNCDGVVDVSDEVCLIEYMFLDGDLPINPCFEFE